ncbi:MAG: hypothetical protein ABIK89_23305 [Planctomycetota bacterium]
MKLLERFAAAKAASVKSPWAVYRGLLRRELAREGSVDAAKLVELAAELELTEGEIGEHLQALRRHDVLAHLAAQADASEAELRAANEAEQALRSEYAQVLKSWADRLVASDARCTAAYRQHLTATDAANELRKLKLCRQHGELFASEQ